jgi:putative cardiolipin synthase
MTDFLRVNRRMHNKSYTADGVATIVGGRNIGDEYFGADEDIGFIDLDVIAIGAAVPEVQKSFDDYWSSASAYPVDRLLPLATSAQVERFDAQGVETGQSARAQAYMDAVHEGEIVHKMITAQMYWEWAEARVVVDDPAKALDRAKRKDYLMSSLEHVVGPPKKELRLVSPYFVPTKAGVVGFTKMRERGVQVSILTNALEATDVAAVHAGYAKWRKDLLRQGVRLWELRRTAVPAPIGGVSGRAVSSSGSGSGSRGSGSSGEGHGAVLHAKTFAVDREQVFVGSFNFDPRSAALNTELGLVIRSTVLAGRVARAFDDRIPTEAYEVELTPAGKLQWVERQAEKKTVYNTEPGTSGWRRFCVAVMSLLPIDWLL